MGTSRELPARRHRAFDAYIVRWNSRSCIFGVKRGVARSDQEGQERVRRVAQSFFGGRTDTVLGGWNFTFLLGTSDPEGRLVGEVESRW